MTCNPGFNVDGAIKRLQQEALKEGATADPGCDPADPYAVALPHVLAHGIQENGPRCATPKCKLAGLCFALLESLEYRREATCPTARSLLVLRDLSSDAHAELTTRAIAFVNEGLPAIEPLLAAYRFALKHGLAQRAEWILTKLKEWGRIVELQAQLLAASGALSEDICEPIARPELLKRATPGRSADLLLTSMYQHLSYGGYSPREAGALVRDSLGGKYTNRVRNRMNAPDARSIVPADLSSSP
mgnify:FL=1